ncbi:WecB/TagA/CpsF family glycosyltransferase [Haloechinothrix sp. YIM 98757]|uniref:WecB/TagA/CpsF family glycosyltransferase n=1 Tax=Haloechinothrix aidingensis TaxID=2752311 RepID=A0A838A1P1_9PSEU|nr:WecB/TagA/CpsF family glycosyltransferase [Haloechinothrix aidingensis]MBA0125073.1 WecB/TagA/CpsF family glycosyltransferase [Haloechinothrix aidingensis]
MTSVAERPGTRTETRVDVLGVGVSVTSLPHALDTVTRWVEQREQHYVCVTGVHGVMESQHDTELMRIHNESGLTVPDGAPLLWAGRYAGAAGMGRVRGPDLLPAVAGRAARDGWRVYLYGGAEQTPELLARNLRARYPGISIVGAYSPPFRPLTAEEEAEVVAGINASGADIVMVGLSTPKQEQWMSWASGRIEAPAMFGFGAAFDIHAGVGSEAPAWVRPTGFEWLYRMGTAPRRLAPRYLRNNPRFVASVLRRPPRLREIRPRDSAAPQGPDRIAPPGRARRVARAVFGTLERARVHVLPTHYYSPVPDRAWLRRNQPLWRKEIEPRAIGWDTDAQLRWLEAMCSGYLHEVRGFPFLPRLAGRGIAFRYGPIEAQVLHCVVRTMAPGRIIEIGSGASTAVMSDAVGRNVAEGRRGAGILAIDPYMPEELRGLDHVEVAETPAQQVDTSVFAELGDGDLLFIDSTHVLKTGSEVQRIYLELLPALPPGVLVHIHDIYLPYLYSPWVLGDVWDWQETALLTALLTGNQHFAVLACQSALHHARPDELRRVLPDFRPLPTTAGIDEERSGGHFPSSTWLLTR